MSEVVVLISQKISEQFATFYTPWEGTVVREMRFLPDKEKSHEL